MSRSVRAGRWRRADVSVTTEVLDGEAVLYDVRTRQLVHLNQTATKVWLRCDGTTTVAQIVDAMTAEFGRTREEVDPEVVTLVDELANHGLLIDADTGA